MPEGENWYLHAHFKETWLFGLPIYDVSAEAEFPDILNVSDQDLYYLQAGWRASDEGDVQGRPRMGTTKPWQVIAWSATRPGKMWIYISGLNINKKGPTLQWILESKTWEQEWSGREGKRKAQQIQHILSGLTSYLGDGMKIKGMPTFYDGREKKPITRECAQAMISYAYTINYGTLLDLLGCDKWEELKRFAKSKKLSPIHVTLDGYTFTLAYDRKDATIIARTHVKNIDEAIRLFQTYKASTFKEKNKNSITVQLKGHSVLRLAEQFPEWRNGLKKLTQKYNIQPRGFVTKRLLELAENPPPLARAVASRHNCTCNQPR
jgi:hypothetical protein